MRSLVCGQGEEPQCRECVEWLLCCSIDDLRYQIGTSRCWIGGHTEETGWAYCFWGEPGDGENLPTKLEQRYQIRLGEHIAWDDWNSPCWVYSARRRRNIGQEQRVLGTEQETKSEQIWYCWGIFPFLIVHKVWVGVISHSIHIASMGLVLSIYLHENHKNQPFMDR